MSNFTRSFIGYKPKEKTAKVPCSQCGFSMPKTIADLQAENNRPNHPICEPCCLGMKRSNAQIIEEEEKLLTDEELINIKE